ncbi:Fc.00g095480.m01.CDS01 [Cosmosporella sp. VM-42]
MSLKLSTESMREKLEKHPKVFEALLPDYPPIYCQPTPEPGYLEAICQDNVEFIPTAIKRVHRDGIETEDGKFRKVDTIITATGFDTSYLPRFPVQGRNGVTLNELWEVYPEAYVSIFAEQMPNYMISLGPNGAPPSGSTVLAIEAQCEYMVECAQKCHREGYNTIEFK